MSKKAPRDYHDYDNELIGNSYEKLSSVRDIISCLMDDLYAARIQETPTLTDRDYREAEDDYEG